MPGGPPPGSRPGYHLLAGVGQGARGDVWKVEGGRGRTCRALGLHSCIAPDPGLADRLQGLVARTREHRRGDLAPRVLHRTVRAKDDDVTAVDLPAGGRPKTKRRQGDGQ